MDDNIRQQGNHNNRKGRGKQNKQQNYDEDFQKEDLGNRRSNEPIALPKIIAQKSDKNSYRQQEKVKANKRQDEYDEIDLQEQSYKNSGERERIMSKKSPNRLQRSRMQESSGPGQDKYVGRHQNSKRASQSHSKSNSTAAQSKYLYYLKNQFPHIKQEINQFAPQKINRLNQKLRTYIKKVSDELSELIDQNMRKLKADSQRTNVQTKSVEDQIRLLLQHKKTRQLYLQTLGRQTKKIISKFGRVEQQELQANVAYQIKQITQKIKQYSKQINSLKLNMHFEGNKLAEEKNFGDKINQTKNKLNKLRKQQQKNVEKLQKCEKQYDQLSKKSPQIEIDLQRLIQKGKRQNISVSMNSQDRRKVERMQELKRKYQNLKLHKDKTQGLNGTKTNILKRDTQVLRNSIAEIDERFSHIDTQLKQSIQSSKNIIQQAQKRNLQPHIHAHLDFIYKNIKQGNPLSKFNLKPFRNSKQMYNVEKNVKTGMKKHSSVVNIHSYSRSQSEAELKPSFHITKKTPLNLKYKQKNGVKLSQKLSEQRVWKQADNKTAEYIYRNKQSKQVSSKPFILKRSHNTAHLSAQSSMNTKQMQNLIINNNQESRDQNSSLLSPKVKLKKAQNTQKPAVTENSKTLITQKSTNQTPKITTGNESSKPQFKIKKAVKQIVDIPQQELYPFLVAINQNTKEITPQQPIVKQKQLFQIVRETNVNSKGPNFKLNRNSSQSKLAKKLVLPSSQTKKQTLKLQQTPKQRISANNQSKGETNLTGRRQVQNKLQRKTQGAYAT